jgi:hypothetical protein
MCYGGEARLLYEMSEERFRAWLEEARDILEWV